MTTNKNILLKEYVIPPPPKKVIGYELELKRFKKRLNLRTATAWHHFYHKNILHKKVDIERCIICLCLGVSPTITV